MLRQRNWQRVGNNHPITLDEMRNRAKWRVETAYAVSPDDLAIIAEEQESAAAWKFTLEDDHGRYFVEFGVVDGDLLTTRTRWEQR